MSRRTRRLRPCPMCWDMGADAPAVTHRVVYRFPASPDSIFGGPTGPEVARFKVCEYHARDIAWSSGVVTAYRLKRRRR